MLDQANLAIYARKLFGRLGLDIARADTPFLEPEFVRYLKICEPYTMVSRERLYAHFQAVRHVVQNDIEGDIVECGVWRGGTSMLGALTLLGLNEATRNLWLYDTFAGMTEPGADDVSPWDGNIASRLWSAGRKADHNEFCYSPIEDVRANLARTNYPADRLHFIKGDVVETLKTKIPNKIAVLRLDTDWYESTKAEMEVLFPRLASGGVLLVDDYGAWQGARKAVDEYIAEHRLPLLLHRTDYTGRSAVKTTG